MSKTVPIDWIKRSLEYYSEINPRLTKRNDLTSNTDVSFLKMEDVSNEAKIKRRGLRKYSDVSKGFTCFQDGDVLVAKITPCFENGKGGYVTNLVNGVGFGSTEFHILRANEKTDSRYLYHFTNYKSFRLEGESNMTGSAGQRRVPTDFFRNYQAIFPPLPEQQKIASILTAVDDVIESTQAQINKLKDLKAGMMQELLTKGIGHTEFKDSPVGRIPKAWECCLLGTVARRGSGHTPDKQIDEYWNGGIKWISLADSSKLDRLYISTTAHEISELGLKNSSAIMHPPGTVVLSRDAGVGKSAIATESMAVSQHFMAWICGEKLNNYFLYYLLQLWKPRFENIAIGSTIKTIGLPYFKSLAIPLPRIAEQGKIAKSLLSADDAIFKLEKKRKDLLNIKKALMQDLLTGKVRVKVDNR